jgi:hypothetical protein
MIPQKSLRPVGTLKIRTQRARRLKPPSDREGARMDAVRRALQRTLAITIYMVWIGGTSSPVVAQTATEPTFLCGAGSTLVALSGVATGTNSSISTLRRVAGASYLLSTSDSGRSADDVSARHSTQVKLPTVDKAPICFTNAAMTLRAESGAPIPGRYVAALAAVLAFREKTPFPEPLGSAHASRPDTTISIRDRGANEIVLIADRIGRNGGCGAQEYYFVDGSTFAVTPFDGCIEGHYHPPSLAHSKDLPQ